MLHGMQPANTVHSDTIGSPKWDMLFRAKVKPHSLDCARYYPILCLHEHLSSLLPQLLSSRSMSAKD